LLKETAEEEAWKFNVTAIYVRLSCLHDPARRFSDGEPVVSRGSPRGEPLKCKKQWEEARSLAAAVGIKKDRVGRADDRRSWLSVPLCLRKRSK